MDFHPASPTEGMPVRWASENNTWEIGLRPMMYGIRVSVGKIEPEHGHAMVYTLDYCAGNDQAFLINLWATIVILMCALPESITPGELKKLFPTCWEELQRLVRLEEPFPAYQDAR